VATSLGYFGPERRIGIAGLGLAAGAAVGTASGVVLKARRKCITQKSFPEKSVSLEA